MPWFRFLDDPRVTLKFRNGSCELGFRVFDQGPDDVWAWVARKEDGTEAVLIRRGNVAALHHDLREDGFEVEAGSVAEKILRSAIRAGHVEELPDDADSRRGFLRERLIQAKVGRR